MFAISIDQKQHCTYTLYDQAAQAELEVVPERGGLITHWRLGGQEILYFDAERFADPSLSVRGGIPVLFPICGNLPDNQYTLNSQTYTLKQHGFGRDMPWDVVERATHNEAALTVQLTQNEQTLAVYPFEFCVQLTYRLAGKTLTIDQVVENRSDRTLPFSLGFHPYFQVNDKTQLKFDIPADQFQDQITKEMHPFTGAFADITADEIDVAFKPLSRQWASVQDCDRNLSLTLTYEDAFSTLVFWTVKGKNYYCLEPWTAPRNALNTGDSLIRLDPQQSFTSRITFEVNTQET